jgi:protein SCO1
MRALAPVALAAVVLVISGCGGRQAAAPKAATSSSGTGLHGLVPQPFPHKPNFVLSDTAGRPYDLARRTRGKLTYLYFGYTHCPDACPLTMADLAGAVHAEPESVRAHVSVVFVTVDPRRDTPHVLRRWLDHFDPGFVGLTGTRNEITAAERAAGIPLAAPEKVKGANYAVAHSTLVLAYSPDGLAHVVYSQGFRTRDYKHDMPLLLRYVER